MVQDDMYNGVNTPTELINHPFILYQNGVIEKLTRNSENLTKAVESYQARISKLESQLQWFKKGTFDKKSERRVSDTPPTTMEQLPLLAMPVSEPDSVVVKTTTVAEHVRKKSIKKLTADNCGESALRLVQRLELKLLSCPTQQLWD